MALATVLAGVLLWSSPAWALNPALDISQYAHTAWKIREGFPKGVIVAFAQTPDGYLWLGTEYGLVRFDGVRYIQWHPPPGQPVPNIHIKCLLATRDGSLWIGTSDGLAKWQGGNLTAYAEFAGQSIASLLEDHEGSVWVGVNAVPNSRLCAIRSGNIQCFGQDGVFGRTTSEAPNASYIDSLYEDREANLWVGGVDGLWRWKPGSPNHYPMPDRVQALVEDDKGTLLIPMLSGIRQFAHGKTDLYPVPGMGPFPARAVLQDRDGGVWIGTTDRGLVHVHQGTTDVFERSDGLSADFVEKFFEDREGNIWVATIDGLDRFHDLSIPTISAKQGLSNPTVESVLVAKDGTVWLGTVDGLDRWNNGRITVYRSGTTKPGKGSAAGAATGLSAAGEPGRRGAVREITASGLPDDAIHSLFQDCQDRIWVSTLHGVAFLENGRFIPVRGVPGQVQSLAGDCAGNIWVSQNESLFHLHGGTLVERIPWTKLGHEDYARASVVDPVRGGLWLGFRNSVLYFADGQIRASYTVADGLGQGRVRDLQIDREGTLWIATEGGLSRLKDGRLATLSNRNGLPCSDAFWLMEDGDHSFWLYLACGLVHIARPELEAWAVTAGKDPNRQIQNTVFDSSDGVRSHSSPTGYSPSAAMSADGKLWFLPWDGASILDPHRLVFNPLPPPVHIEQIIADRQTYDATSGKGSLHLPPLIRDLEIDYTALSLVAPEKVLCRYKLENWDREWQDVGNRRQAYYGHLPPGNYRFRVIACNNSGVWNEAGASLDFSIAPAYYQATWFRALVVTGFLALLWGLHRHRLYQVRKEFNARMEGRVSERTRVARDLHDTLLQSFQGVLLKFCTLKYVIRDRPAEAEETLERLVEQARQAITEGRDAVQGLRSSTVVANDLARAIGTFGEGLAADHTGANGPQFRVHVEGKSRDLPPLVRDEVYHVACETLRNAFRHARARRIEVEIRYDPRQFRFRIVDNGKGIDPAVLRAGGRAGHHGLPGIHERAELAGGKLSVWSRFDSGTEIELTIPGSIAYTKSPPDRRSKASGKGAG